MPTDIETCARVQARLSDRLHDRRAVMHVGDCADCGHFATVLGRILAVAPSTGAHPPADLERRLQTAVDVATTGATTERPRRLVPAGHQVGTWGRLVTLAATAAVLVATLMLTTRPDPSPPTLAAAAQHAATTPATFTFAGMLNVTRDTPALPSLSQQTPATQATAAPTAHLITVALEAPTMPQIPQMDLDIPAVEPPDMPIPGAPGLPSSRLDDVQGGLTDLQNDLRRLGITWQAGAPRAEVHYRGHGRTDGNGHYTFTVDFRTDTRHSESVQVVTAGHDVWMRSHPSEPWIHAQGEVALHVGTVSVPFNPAVLLDDLHAHAGSAEPLETRNGQRYAVLGGRGRIQADLADATSITTLAWQHEATAGAGLHVRAQLKTHIEFSSTARVDIPVDAVDVGDVAPEQLPAILLQR